MIKQSIDQDIKAAMLSGDKQRVLALKNLKSAILSAEIAEGKRDEGIGDQATISLLQKELKKRNEAAEMYDQGGNSPMAAGERYEAEVIQAYLPQQLEESAIKELIEQAVASYDGELNGQAMGKLIAAVKDAAGGAADGATVARLVKERIQS
jgi:uncharacterized protein YqeY